MIERERRGDVSAPRKGDQPDAIVRPFLDELRNRVFRHGKSIYLLPFDDEILRLHAPGKIERYNNIDAAGANGSVGAGELRPRQSDDKQRERKPAQAVQKSARARATGLADVLQQRY